MADRIQLRRDTSANWTTYNPILLEGEPGIEIDTDQWKMGDGIHNWSQLPYRGGEVVQQEGQSTTVAMSQKAVTDSIKSIDSKTRAVDSGSDDQDLDFSDFLGNVILRVNGGHIKTKNFDSQDEKLPLGQNPNTDLDFSDFFGKVILRVNGGHIKTKNFDSSVLINAVNQWDNKVWFAYGTSLTAYQPQYTQRGFYAEIVAQELNLQLTNRGSGGSGMTTYSDHVVYDRIMTLEDGKADADLITIECGPNDAYAPLGNLSDHADNSTICGALNKVLEYLQENTHARIVVMSGWPCRYSPGQPQDRWYPWRTMASDNHTWYEMCQKIKDVCNQAGVEYIPLSEESGIGQQARMFVDTDNNFIYDQIHPTHLGAYNVAKYVISKLMNVTNWYNNL